MGKRLLLARVAGLPVTQAAAKRPRHHRLQLKLDGQHLGAASCASPTSLNPGSTSAAGADQRWRLGPEPVRSD